MGNITCKICNEVFAEDSNLHRHLKAHKIRIEDYYVTHFPRKDLFDDAPIKFKNKEQYFSTDFNGRLNLKKWIKEKPEEEVKSYIKELLVRRKEKKGIKYSPCQVELRSLITPPIKVYNKFFKNYYNLCSELGLINKFDNFNKIEVDESQDFTSCKIFVDSREQRPLVFSRASEMVGLKFGDYTFSNPASTGNCYIERKSVNDLIGTLSGGYERFIREIERAKANGAYLVILVEESFNNCMGFNFLPHVYQKGVKPTPEFVFHNVREILQNYLDVQFLFVDGRKEASRVVEKIFTCGLAYKKIDLQFAYDEKRL